MTHSNSNLPLFGQAENHGERIAIIDENGKYTYKDLLTASRNVASLLLSKKTDLGEARIAMMVPSGFHYVASQWGIWMAGGIAVPLCTSHPLPEIEYVLQDSDVEMVIVHELFEEKLKPLASKTARGSQQVLAN